MAAKCAWNGGQSLLEKVADLSTSIDEARGNKSDRQIIQEFKKGIISQIRQEVEINIEELPEQLPDILEELSFILDDDANLPEPDEIMSWFQTNLDVAEKLEKSMETEDLNKPSEEQQIKEEFDRDFMQQAFGISQNARNLFTGFANSVAVNSFIFSGKDHKHINKNSYDFDVAVRNAQKDLFKYYSCKIGNSGAKKCTDGLTASGVTLKCSNNSCTISTQKEIAKSSPVKITFEYYYLPNGNALKYRNELGSKTSWAQFYETNNHDRQSLMIGAMKKTFT